MISQFFKIVILTAIAVGPLSTPASAEPLSGQEIEGILLELSTIEDVLSGKRVSIRTTAVRAFEAAASSDKAAYEFYMQCHKSLNFDAKDASFSDFRQWREKNEDKVKAKGNLAAIRLQLQYLVLTMKAAEGVKMEIIIPQLESFVANIVGHTEDLEKAGMRTLKGSVKSTIFAEAYKLNKSLELKNWCYEPGSIGGVYDKAVFPYFRSEHGEQLAAAWDRRIGLEKRSILITKEDNQYELDKFQKERLPQLYWQKAADIYQSYSQQQGAQAMLSILKSNPDHTSLKSWVEQFKALLKAGANKPSAVPESVAPVDQSNPFGFEKG